MSGDFIAIFIGIFIVHLREFHCGFHCASQGISLWFSLCISGDFIAIFIVDFTDFHCNFILNLRECHYNFHIFSLQFSLCISGDFIVIFIVNFTEFHYNFHCTSQGISFSFIVWPFHISLGIWAISLNISLGCLGYFIRGPGYFIALLLNISLLVSGFRVDF